MDPESEDAYDARALVCHACAVRGRAVDGKNYGAGTYVTVEREGEG